MRTEYTTEIVHDPPLILPARVYVFPKRVEEVERGALHVMVRPASAEPWLGIFALGYASSHVLTGVFPTAHPWRFVAVSGGYGYLVDVREPERTVFLKEEPVVTALKSDAPEQLLLGTHRTVTAIDESGVAWTTAPLSSEGLSELRISGGELCGIGWDAVSDSDRAFRVDLLTGAVVLN